MVEMESGQGECYLSEMEAHWMLVHLISVLVELFWAKFPL
jgi:hypothetical protein